MGLGNENVGIVGHDLRFGVVTRALWKDNILTLPDWVGSTAQLGTGRVRLEISWDSPPLRGAPCPGGPAASTVEEAFLRISLAPFFLAVQAYKSADIEPLILFSAETLCINEDAGFSPAGKAQCPSGPLAGMDYIAAFATRATWIATQLINAYDVTCFEIWNEPNNRGSSDYIDDPETFARLVATTALSIRQAVPTRNLTIVTGGILFLHTPDNAINTTGDEAAYLEPALQYLLHYGVVWDKVGVHLYIDDPFTQERCGVLRDLQQFLSSPVYRNPREPFAAPIWITEFGSFLGGCPELSVPGAQPSSQEQRGQLVDLDLWYQGTIIPALQRQIIDASFWFTYEANPLQPPALSCNQWGLIALDDSGTRPGAPWQSWIAIQSLIGRSLGTPSPALLSIGPYAPC